MAAVSNGGAACLATADSSGAWFCQLAPTPAPGSYRVTATQTASFAGSAASPASAPVTLVVDTAAPLAPALSSPSDGAALPLSGASYSGTGVDGTRAYVYVDRVNTCDAAVSGGAWSCTGGTIAAGPHRVSAIAGDSAGNYSPPSPWIDVTFAAATTAPTVTPSATAPTAPGASPTATGTAAAPAPSSASPTATAAPARPGQTAPAPQEEPSGDPTAAPASRCW
ncbi:hypothetical protein C5C27_07675 [Rathayibacter sp. AY2B7]|nr:hypothetical protein C5C27_07675 [Rathayibacter sp. AY2B7]